MDRTFKPPAGSTHMSTRIPQATRDTHPTTLVPTSTEVPKSQSAPPTKAALPFTNADPSRARRTFSPHIMIYPWDGSSWSRQEFTNQLLAQTYFHPDETREGKEKMIWAISHFQGHAADIAGDFMARLISKDSNERNRMRENQDWIPECWEGFLYVYLEIVEKRVKRRREWWITKAVRCVGLFAYFVLGCTMWLAVVVLGAGLLLQLGGVAAENSDGFWTSTRERILPIV